MATARGQSSALVVYWLRLWWILVCPDSPKYLRLPIFKLTIMDSGGFEFRNGVSHFHNECGTGPHSLASIKLRIQSLLGECWIRNISELNHAPGQSADECFPTHRAAS